MSSLLNYNEFDLGIFNQERYWLNADGYEIEIIEMSTDYLLTLIKYLEVNAPDFYLVQLKQINLKLEAKDESLLIQERINREFTGKQSWDSTPMEWLGSTLLFRTLLMEKALRGE